VSENEGNALMSVSFPKLHIVVAGIEKIVSSLGDLDLFEQREAVFQMPKEDGTTEPVKLAEYFAVSEAKLAALTPEKLAEIRDNGALEKVYNHMTSLVGWDKLVAIASERAIRRAGPIQ